MITVEQAVDATLSYVARFEKLLPTSNVRLEEFELDDRSGLWNITLSFAEPQVSLAQTPTRNYRTFAVQGDTGQVVSMRLRNPLAR